MGPLIPDDGPRGARLKRRARGIATIVGGLVVLTLAAPLVALAAAAVDAVLWVLRRKPWTATRLAAFAWWFLAGEVRALGGILRAYVAAGGRDTASRRRAIYRERQRWAMRLLTGIRVIFGMRIDVEDAELAAPGGALVAIRHASIIDNLLPDVVVGLPHGIGLRFVIKKELESLPVIDIGARMVPTNLIRRGSGNVEAELVETEKLAVDLGADESVLIYPEGTRWTAPKLEAAKARLHERRPDLAELAAPLRATLPPRTAGFLRLRGRLPDADVVLIGHAGLDGLEHLKDIWRGGLVGLHVRVRLWRYAAGTIPTEPAELERWLYARWVELDAWVFEMKQRPAGAG